MVSTPIDETWFWPLGTNVRVEGKDAPYVVHTTFCLEGEGFKTPHTVALLRQVTFDMLAAKPGPRIGMSREHRRIVVPQTDCTITEPMDEARIKQVYALLLDRWPDALLHKKGGVYSPLAEEPFTWKGNDAHDGELARRYIHLWPHPQQTFGRPISEFAPPNYRPLKEAL